MIRKYFYRDEDRLREAREMRQTRARLSRGRRVRIGKTYTRLLTDHQPATEGLYTPIVYEDGLLIVRENDDEHYILVDTGASAEGDGLYIADDILTRIHLKRDLEEILKDDDPVRSLRKAASYKWMFPLSEKGAEMIIKQNSEAGKMA